MVGHLSERHWPRVIFGGSYLSDEEDSILDDQFLQLRYSYLLSPRTRTFHFAQVQRNQTLLLDGRWLLGAGIRRTFLETERTSLSLGTGLMGEWERLDPDQLSAGDAEEADAVRLANLAVFTWTAPSGPQLVGVLYLQPRADDLGDTRLLTDLGLSVPLTGGVGVSVALEWRRDSRPPRALSRDDLHLTTGLALSIP